MGRTCKTDLNEENNEHISSEDDRSSLAIGYTWAARIFSLGIEMVIPILLGVWLDKKFGTVVVFLLLGTMLGMFTGFTQLIKIAKGETKESKKK